MKCAIMNHRVYEKSAISSANRSIAIKSSARRGQSVSPEASSSRVFIKIKAEEEGTERASLLHLNAAIK